MNIAAIPRIDSVVLTGLDFSMKPESVRHELKHGWVKPYPEIKVMHQLKALAIMVYNQEKMTPYYHGNVCDGRNPLAYFICAVHRQQAPQPKTHSRQSSNASNASASSSASCTSTRKSKNCKLPKLVTTSMLPLGYWDCLYYALVAEIRQLHGDLQNRFGFLCENGTQPIHHAGPDGTTNQPISAIDLASMLETAWYSLMDVRLVATLDDAIRMRKLRENSAKMQAGTAKQTDVDIGDRPPVIYGLMDVNALSPEVIISLLWDKHAPEIDRACSENFEDESMLTAYRAEMHAKQVDEGVAAGTPLPSAPICTCHRACVCRLKCDEDADGCTCKNRVHIYHLIHEQESDKSEIQSKYIKQEQHVPNQFLGAATNTLAQLQVAAMADPNQISVRACYNVTEVGKILERQAPRRNRKRTNTNNSELAYVPGPKTPHRGLKDTYPLEFYGRDSGQRYPPMHTQGQIAAPYNSNAVTRKPVPPPITTSGAGHPYTYERSQSRSQGYHHQALTPPTSSPYDVQTFAHAGQVSYPAIPVSQSQSKFTQSFPAPVDGTPREEHDENTAAASSTVPQAYNDPAQDYITLLARHPSLTINPDHPTEPFPRLSRTVTSSPPKKAHHHTASTTNQGLPTLKTFSKLNKPQPPLPEPDFIAPRPAVKQRYVSAGGTAKLSERAEIPGPAFTTATLPSAQTTTKGMISKEEVDAKMSDPEWVRKNFGESALARIENATGTGAGVMTPPRKSGESSKRNSGSKSKRNSSGRKSDESARGYDAVDKRDRTSSGASGRVAKLKRVFSRKNSGTEMEALSE